MVFHPAEVEFHDQHLLLTLPMPDKGISVSLACHVLAIVSRREWETASENKSGVQPLHGLLYPPPLPPRGSGGPYRKQWAAVRIQWASRMLPPQMCCLSYWTLTCQGQESTEASSPPTTRGVFRGLPQAGRRRRRRKSGFWGRGCSEGSQAWYGKVGRDLASSELFMDRT